MKECINSWFPELHIGHLDYISLQHGGSEDNLKKKIGGDSLLTEEGDKVIM